MDKDEQIELMKNCQNCRNNSDNGCIVGGMHAKCDLWELERYPVDNTDHVKFPVRHDIKEKT